jgi:hypothetical protein
MAFGCSGAIFFWRAAVPPFSAAIVGATQAPASMERGACFVRSFVETDQLGGVSTLSITCKTALLVWMFF